MVGRIAMWSLGMLATLALPVCSSSENNQGRPQKVLGAIFADDIDEMNKSELYAIRLAVEEINRSQAFEFELKVANRSPARGDFFDPQKAAENVRLLHDTDRALAYNSAHGSESSYTMNTVTNQLAYSKFVRCANSATEVTSNLPGWPRADETDTFYRTVVNIDRQFDLGVKLFAPMGWLRFVLYRVDDQTGAEVSLGMQDKVDRNPEYGYSMVYDAMMKPGTFVLEDNLATLNKIIEMSNKDEMDVLVVGLTQALANGAIKYLTENNYTGGIHLSTISTTDELFNIATGIGAWMRQDPRNIIIGYEMDCYAGKNAGAFVEAFEARYGKEPRSYDASAYDCTYTLALALAYAGKEKRTTAGIWEGMQKFKEDRHTGEEVEVGVGAAEFARAVSLIEQGQRVEYQGVSGRIWFDQNGDRPKMHLRTFGPNAAGNDWEVKERFDEDLNKI